MADAKAAGTSRTEGPLEVARLGFVGLSEVTAELVPVATVQDHYLAAAALRLSDDELRAPEATGAGDE